jgi:hypothetical protein
MYNPPKFMTMKVLAEVLAEFKWPAPYTLEDELPDYIAVVFPKCTLFFEEGFESNMGLRFSADNTGLDMDVKLKDVLVSMGGVGNTPGLIKHFAPTASLDKVKNGIRDLCTIILTHFRSSILGDFNWVEKYKAYNADKAR